jgi:hypothetical protein
LLRAIVKTFGRLYCFVGLIQLVLSAVFRLVNEICKEIYDNAACEDLVLLGYDAVVNPSSSRLRSPRRMSPNDTGPHPRRCVSPETEL